MMLGHQLTMLTFTFSKIKSVRTGCAKMDRLTRQQVLEPVARCPHHPPSLNLFQRRAIFPYFMSLSFTQGWNSLIDERGDGKSFI